MTRVLIVDDHAMLREGIRRLLTEQNDMEVVGEAGEIQTAMTLLADKPCDVVILDISLPGASGFDLLKPLRLNHPNVAVLILSMHNDQRYVLRAVEMGARGYITKGVDQGTLLEAVRAVAAGKTYVSQDVAGQLIQKFSGSQSPESPLGTLSPRELEVLSLLAGGNSTKEVAARLGMSDKTVATHRIHIMRKLKITNVAGLVRYALQHNLDA